MSKKLQYFKATRPNGRDFYTNTVDYGQALLSGDVITHRHTSKEQVKGDAGTYLSISTGAADCTGMRWPCRLFVVEPVGRALKADSSLPNKRRVSKLRVVAELPAHEVFGPNGAKVAALIERVGRLTSDEVNRLCAAWNAARNAAWRAAGRAAGDAAGDGAGYAAWNAAWRAGDAAGDAAGYAALALVVQDLITVEQFNKLYAPWQSVIGES